MGETERPFKIDILRQQSCKLSGLLGCRVWEHPSAKINSGKRTEWSPIRSVIIRVITKSDDRKAEVRFVNHDYDYRPTSDDTKSTY